MTKEEEVVQICEKNKSREKSMVMLLFLAAATSPAMADVDVAGSSGERESHSLVRTTPGWWFANYLTLLWW